MHTHTLHIHCTWVRILMIHPDDTSSWYIYIYICPDDTSWWYILMIHPDDASRWHIHAGSTSNHNHQLKWFRQWNWITHWLIYAIYVITQIATCDTKLEENRLPEQVKFQLHLQMNLIIQRLTCRSWTISEMWWQCKRLLFLQTSCLWYLRCSRWELESTQ